MWYNGIAAIGIHSNLTMYGQLTQANNSLISEAHVFRGPLSFAFTVEGRLGRL